jgi:formylglycine-generating enzyme required for sulfatase activity
MRPFSCPEAAQLKDLLDGKVSADLQGRLTSHLDLCERCQKILEGLADDAESWSATARHLSDQPSPPEPALQQVVDKLRVGDRPTETQAESIEESDYSLSFLRAPEAPGYRGRLGNYDVIEVLGAGGMGIVLRAFDPALHRIVAIKVLAPHLATSANARRRFNREALAAAAVGHDHVVTIHAVEEAEGLPFLVMQYIRGVSLQDRLDRSGPLELEQILRIGTQIASGLAAAHAQGLIHRDIKPGNILLENGVERVKITDFGLARAVNDAGLTQSGVVSGTPQYMAPEQARGESLDTRADLFSLGSVLYAMCTGRPPFEAATIMGVLRQVSDETPRPIRETHPEVPPWLANLIAKLQAKAPKDRFQSAAEVARLLEQHLHHLHQPELVPGALSGGRSGSRLWLGVGGVLLMLVVGLMAMQAIPFTSFIREGSQAKKQTVSAPPAEPVEKEVTCSIGMKLRWIPAGTFHMGSPDSEAGRTPEELLHPVQITTAFYMGAYEVTQEEYRRVMGQNPSWFSPEGGGNTKVAGQDTGRLPVENVSWEEAVEFCRRLSELPAEREARRVYRLPTEAEWEYACRAGTQTAFHYGPSLSSALANFDGRTPYGQAERGPYAQQTMPVGSHAPNAWGLYDMHGNVWEWCQDAYLVNFYQDSPVEDPHAGIQGEQRVVRGGSWYSTGAACRAAFRHKNAPDLRSNYIGFRVLYVPLEGTP